MARLICTGCGTQVSHADVVCACGRPLLGDGATTEAPAASPAPAADGRLDPAPDPEQSEAGPAAEKCPYCQAEIPEPRPLWCIMCTHELPPREAPAGAAAEPRDASPYGTIREVSEARLVLVFAIAPQETPVATVELTMGQQLLLSRESTDRRLAGLRGKTNVSRCHATVGLAADGAWVRDERSTNGTFVDGRRVAPEVIVKLADGAELRLASNVYATVQLRRPGRSDDGRLG